MYFTLKYIRKCVYICGWVCTHACAHLYTYNLLTQAPLWCAVCYLDTKYTARGWVPCGWVLCFIHFCFKSLAHRKYLIQCLIKKQSHSSSRFTVLMNAELAASRVPTVMMPLRMWARRNSWALSPESLASGPDVWKETQSRECHLSCEPHHGWLLVIVTCFDLYTAFIICMPHGDYHHLPFETFFILKKLI